MTEVFIAFALFITGAISITFTVSETDD